MCISYSGGESLCAKYLGLYIGISIRSFIHTVRIFICCVVFFIGSYVEYLVWHIALFDWFPFRFFAWYAQHQKKEVVRTMTEKYRDADAIVTIEGKEYALYKNGPLKNYPYMIDVATGRIPLGEQRPLLKSYLVLNGVNIDPWNKRNTHWCVMQALKVVHKM